MGVDEFCISISWILDKSLNFVMTDSNLKKWYVVRAVSGQNKVKAYIENEISRLEMGDYVSQVLVPTEK
jgi:predicted nucleotidyltransferase